MLCRDQPYGPKPLDGGHSAICRAVSITKLNLLLYAALRPVC